MNLPFVNRKLKICIHPIPLKVQYVTPGQFFKALFTGLNSELPIPKPIIKRTENVNHI